MSPKAPEMHGSNDENFEGDCSEGKCRWMSIYPYQADNRDGRENAGGCVFWAKTALPNTKESRG